MILLSDALRKYAVDDSYSATLQKQRAEADAVEWKTSG
jgi:hypothetical protein